jgi:hypothetical protein
MYKITSQSDDFITYCDKDKCISIPRELDNQIQNAVVKSILIEIDKQVWVGKSKWVAVTEIKDIIDNHERI